MFEYESSLDLYPSHFVTHKTPFDGPDDNRLQKVFSDSQYTCISCDWNGACEPQGPMIIDEPFNIQPIQRVIVFGNHAGSARCGLKTDEGWVPTHLEGRG